MATRKALEGMSTADLVAHYNARSGKKPIKGFHTRKKGIAQILGLTGRKADAPDHIREHVTKVLGDRKRASDKRKIVMLVSDNPKRAETKAHAKFNELLWMAGKTVAEFYALEGKTPELDAEKGWPRIELNWCVKKGWVRLERA